MLELLVKLRAVGTIRTMLLHVGMGDSLSPALQELTGQAGILGSALSGAGPSMLIFLDSNSNVDRIITKIHAHLHNRGLSAELIPAEITHKGAREIRGWNVNPRADAAAPQC